MGPDSHSDAMATKVPLHPACGLYRTTQPLVGAGSEIAASRLVYFHNHSEEGPPIALLPASNKHNRWTFHSHGLLVANPADTHTLQALKPEGLYRFREHFHPDDTRVVAQDSLVQLGYNPAADPLVFFPSWAPDSNSLAFPKSGMKLPPKIYALLDPVTTQGPHVVRQLH